MRDLFDWSAEHNSFPWQARSESKVTLRVLVLLLEALQAMRTQESNRLKVAPDTVCGKI